MMFTLAAIMIIAAALWPLLHRDLKRADQKRRRREWLRTNPKAAQLRASVNAFSAAIGITLLPTMREVIKAAADMEAAMRKVSAAMTMTTATRPTDGVEAREVGGRG